MDLCSFKATFTKATIHNHDLSMNFHENNLEASINQFLTAKRNTPRNGFLHACMHAASIYMRIVTF